MNTRLKKFVHKLLPVLLILITTNANAVDWVIEADLHIGGDDAITPLVDTSGDSHELKAGAGLGFLFGVNHELSSDLQLRVLAGFLAGGLQGKELTTNTAFEYRWSHNPIEVVVLKQTEKFAFGGGLTYHLNPELKGTGFFAGKGTKYDNALGLLGNVDYRFTENFYMGLKYLLISYKSTAGENITGNSFGITIGYAFGN